MKSAPAPRAKVADTAIDYKRGLENPGITDLPPNPGLKNKLRKSQEKWIYTGRTGEKCSRKALQPNRTSASCAKLRFFSIRMSLPASTPSSRYSSHKYNHYDGKWVTGLNPPSVEEPSCSDSTCLSGLSTLHSSIIAHNSVVIIGFSLRIEISLI
jgi:hypothetical protein